MCCHLTLQKFCFRDKQGMLLIKGNDLHVKKLTLEKGEVDIEGKIDSFTYSELISEHRGGESWIGRLFR